LVHCSQLDMIVCKTTRFTHIKRNNQKRNAHDRYANGEFMIYHKIGSTKIQEENMDRVLKDMNLAKLMDVSSENKDNPHMKKLIIIFLTWPKSHNWEVTKKTIEHQVLIPFEHDQNIYFVFQKSPDPTIKACDRYSFQELKEMLGMMEEGA